MRHAAREQAVAAVPDGPDVLREASQADKELLSRSTALQKLKGAAEVSAAAAVRKNGPLNWQSFVRTSPVPLHDIAAGSPGFTAGL